MVPVMVLMWDRLLAGVLDEEQDTSATQLSAWLARNTRDAKLMEPGNMTCLFAEVSKLFISQSRYLSIVRESSLDKSNIAY